MKKGHVPLNKR